MNSETFNRIKEASKYEKMAIRALFPEKVSGHLDIIEGELKEMFKELIIDVVKEEMKQECKEENKDSVKYKRSSTKVKKVEIG